MPVQACRNRVDNCDCTEPPILNLSAEAPDYPYFLSISTVKQVLPIGWIDGDDESGYGAQGCLGWCWSSTSQEDADECAELQAQLCVDSKWLQPVDGGYEQTGMYSSSEKTCTIDCSNGTFTYILPANAVRSVRANLADALAEALCLKRAQAALFCLTSPSGSCVDAAVSEVLVMTGGTAPFTFDLVSGSLPPGLSLTTDGILSGTPTTAGSYPVTIRITDSSGNPCSLDATVTLRCMQLMNPTDVHCQFPAAFQMTLAQNGGSSLAIWSIVSGSLPTGLTLDAVTGVISGTPVTTGSYTFTVQCTDPN